MRLSHVLLLVAGGAVAGWIGFASAPRHDPSRRAAPVTPDPRIEELAARLDRIDSRLEGADRLGEGLDRLDRIAERLDQLDARLAEVLSRPVTPMRESSAAVPVENLRLRAKALSADASTRADAIDAWGAVAERATDTEQMAEAYFEQAEAYSKLEDWKNAASSFRKVVETAGLGDERGRTAAYRLGWCEAWSGDDAAAYRSFRQILETPGLPKSVEAAARLQTASFADATGDLAAARREYERLISDYQDDDLEHYRKIAKAAADRLHEMR